MTDAPKSNATNPSGTALSLAVAGILGTLLGATFAPLVNYLVNERQMDVKMVEIGIGILRAPPKEDIAVMRSWAIDVIEKSSGRRFTDSQRTALLKEELPFAGWTDFQPYRGEAQKDKPISDRFPMNPKK